MTKTNVYEELKSYLEIDKYALDDEISTQAVVYQQVAEFHAACVNRRDAAYENVKVVDAAVASALKDHANQQGIKVTEVTVAAQVMLSTEHKEAVNKHLRAKEQADRNAALKDAFNQRCYMLRELGELFIAGYYSEISVKKTQSVHREHVYDTARKAARRDLKRKA